MKLIILFLLTIPSLLMLINTIYAIINSYNMMLINLTVIGIVILLAGYLIVKELYDDSYIREEYRDSM